MHTTHRLGGLFGTLVVAAMVAVGGWAFLSTYALERAAGPLAVPTLATLLVSGGFVFALFVLGARSDRWLENPYW